MMAIKYTVPRTRELQMKNYLVATGIEVGLLINFGKSVEIKRKYVQKSETKDIF